MPEPIKPKQSIIRRIFGDPISESTDKEWPELKGQWMGRQVERPDLEGNVTSLRPMSMFNRWRYPNAYAVTNPMGGIQLNRQMIEQDKQDLGDVMIHEMTHANQGMGGFLRKFYNPNKDENVAINAESMRKVRKTDIPLRGKEIDPNINVPIVNIPNDSTPIINKSVNTPVDWQSGMKKLRKFALD